MQTLPTINEGMHSLLSICLIFNTGSEIHNKFLEFNNLLQTACNILILENVA